jgi:hypothetical protein|tara:strand:- start:205 stop:459 length:255 start_codon:yes stop_codon:yes gene_type:complete
MVSSVILAGVIALSSPNMDFPKVWEKIDGQWSYVGKVKEKPQVLFWLEKKTKTQSKNLLINEIRKMPFIIYRPKGEIVKLDPLP